MTNIQNLFIISKNGCFVKIGINEKDDLFVWVESMDKAFEILKLKLQGKAGECVEDALCKQVAINVSEQAGEIPSTHP